MDKVRVSSRTRFSAYTWLDGVSDSQAGRQISPEQSLFLATVANCFFDGFLASDAWFRNTDKTIHPDIHRGDARRWLTASFDPWKSDREEVCSLAGLCPDRIQAIAKKRLAAVKAGEAEQQEKTADLDDVLAKLLDAENDNAMTREDLNQALADLASLESAA